MFKGSKKTKQHIMLAVSLEILNMAFMAHEFAQNNKDVIKHNRDKQSQTLDLLGGDYLFSVALSKACCYPQAVKGMTEVINRYVEGEFIKPTLGSSFSAFKRKYLQKISSQDASLLALSSSLGSWCGEARQPEIKKVALMGHHLGIGRKLKKELADFEKNFCNNMKRVSSGVPVSLPLLYVLEKSNKRETLRKTLERSFTSKYERQLWHQEMEKNDYRNYMHTIIKKSYEASLEALQTIEINTGKEKELLINMLTEELR